MIQKLIEDYIQERIKDARCEACLTTELRALQNELPRMFVRTDNVTVAIRLRVEELEIHTRNLKPSCL